MLVESIDWSSMLEELLDNSVGACGLTVVVRGIVGTTVLKVIIGGSTEAGVFKVLAASVVIAGSTMVLVATADAETMGFPTVNWLE